MHAMITGASAGIGEAIARQLAAQGYDLSLVARRESELERVIAELPDEVKARAHVADVTRLDELAPLVARVEQALGPLDVLVNNAGIQIVSRTPAVSPEAGERLLTVNLLAPLRLTLAVIPGMIARGRGTIVEVSSLGALAPTPGMVHYCASKAALGAAAEALRPELRTHGVHVVGVYPGPIQTAMADAAVDSYAEDPLRGLPVGDAATLAKLIAKAIARRRDRVIYPRLYWLARWFPGITAWVMARMSPMPK